MHAGCRRIDKAYQAFSRSVLIAIAVMSSLAAAAAQQGSPGLTQRTTFPAFDPRAPSCAAPPDRTKVLAFVQENEREFLQGVDHGLRMAAKDRGLEYRRAIADNDAARAIAQIRTF